MPGNDYIDSTGQSFNTEEYRLFLSKQLPFEFKQEIKQSFANSLETLFQSPGQDRDALIDKLANVTQSVQLEIFDHYLRNLPVAKSSSHETSDNDIGQQAKMATATPSVAVSTPKLAARPEPNQPIPDLSSIVGQQMPRHSDVTLHGTTFELDGEKIDLSKLDYNHNFENSSDHEFEPNQGNYYPYISNWSDPPLGAAFESVFPGHLNSGHHGEVQENDTTHGWLNPTS